MTNALPKIEDRHKIDPRFIISSAFKRAIGIAKRPENGDRKKLSVARPENKELLGFTAAGSRTSLSVLVVT